MRIEACFKILITHWCCWRIYPIYTCKGVKHLNVDGYAISVKAKVVNYVTWYILVVAIQWGQMNRKWMGGYFCLVWGEIADSKLITRAGRLTAFCLITKNSFSNKFRISGEKIGFLLEIEYPYVSALVP